MNEITLSKKMIHFTRFLKARGFCIFSSDVRNALTSLNEINLLKKESFYYALQATLVKNETEWRLFKEHYDAFWLDSDDTEKEEENQNAPEPFEDDGELLPILVQTQRAEGDTGSDDGEPNEFEESATYCPLSRLERKDFGDVETRDIKTTQLIMKSIMKPFKLSLSRRPVKTRRNENIDFRRMMRSALKTQGMPSELLFRQKKKRLKRLALLVDISGSMDRYARFILPFILGLGKIGAKTEVFVFSTSLTPITPLVRQYAIEKALEKISHRVPDWSGGTRIGYSLHQFNRQYGVHLINRRTVIMIMSDGWDLGGRTLLKREMEYLYQNTHRVIWLNPLAGDRDYQPVCKGMQAALPYVDYFLPANSLFSLKKIGKTLSNIMAH